MITLGIACRIALITSGSRGLGRSRQRSGDGSAPINARIDEIVPRGEFATWRATRAVGDHDLSPG